MGEDVFNGTLLLTIIILAIAIIIIWFLLKNWLRRNAVKKRVTELIPSIKSALSEYKNITNFTYYFSFFIEENYRISHELLRNRIPCNYSSLRLLSSHVQLISDFIDIFKSLSSKREEYNNSFIIQESEKYADFFQNIAEYPLSKDQIEAVIRDEDNNLVIAGAGTGKTTTISAKIAYILEKQLAKPNDLLIIAFTRNAANEMHLRTTEFCHNLLDEESLDVRTFNSFGYMVTRTSSQRHFELAFNGNDDKAKAFLQETFDELFLNDAEFHTKAVNFIAFFSRPPRDEFSFADGNDYMKYEKSFKNVTLDGIEVKSKEEMEIGNFFYLFKVNYKYEHPFPLKPEDENFNHGQYRPDFYLPDYEIWHEHYGIDENGDVPKWFTFRPPFNNARDYYHSLISWKENIHSSYNTNLIKTYSFQNRNQKLLSTLKKQLTDFGVEFEKRTPDEILVVVHSSPYYEDFMDLVYTFLNLMKSNNKEPSFFKQIGNDKRLSTFLEVFNPLYQKYQSKLFANGCIDYNDMINKATNQIDANNYNKRYKYILIDEFQDMSIGRYELLKSLKDKNPGAKIYAVGDDWQSIFRFTGSDISITTQFEEKFGYTQKSKILQTYRFNNEILKITSNFIVRNPSQIQKELTATSEAQIISFCFFAIDFKSEQWDMRNSLKIAKIDEILAEIERLDYGNKVFLIGRYHHNKPQNLTEIQSKYETLDIQFYTAHGVKGLTCDFAILLDIDSGKMGFPSEIADDPILNYLLFEGDDFDNAEERRLFYVAMSRARHRNYFLFDINNPSKFLNELFVDTNVENPFKNSLICQKCTGRMVKRAAGNREFYGCSNFPLCNNIISINSVS